MSQSPTTSIRTRWWRPLLLVITGFFVGVSAFLLIFGALSLYIDVGKQQTSFVCLPGAAPGIFHPTIIRVFFLGAGFIQNTEILDQFVQTDYSPYHQRPFLQSLQFVLLSSLPFGIISGMYSFAFQVVKSRMGKGMVLISFLTAIPTFYFLTGLYPYLYLHYSCWTRY